MTLLTLFRPLSAREVIRAGDRIGRCRHTLRRWIARSCQRRALRQIAEANDFHLLRDIGVSQEDAFREAEKPFWRR